MGGANTGRGGVSQCSHEVTSKVAPAGGVAPGAREKKAASKDRVDSPRLDGSGGGIPVRRTSFFS